MTAKQIAALGAAFTLFTRSFARCFSRRETRRHLATYARGLMSALRRKSAGPMALAGGTAVRTLQEFQTHHVWDHARTGRPCPQHRLPPMAASRPFAPAG